ncbi:hypothetical protein H9L25_02280 [Terrisporobacter mayombei]|nr:hypothetical protein [Terrisporobacter mayombei]
MVTVTKFLTKKDLKIKICDCQSEENLKVLFKEIYETELRIQPNQVLEGAYILRDEKIVARCEECKKIYSIRTTFEGGFKDQCLSVDSIELFDGSEKDLRKILNEMYDEYEEELINIATDDYSVKILDKIEDEEKIITRYAYLNREDKDLYEDLMNK